LAYDLHNSLEILLFYHLKGDINDHPSQGNNIKSSLYIHNIARYTYIVT